MEKLNITRFVDLSKDHLILDVRSPGEFHHAHIPGAYNLPLFTDEERRVVGTTYKQNSREEAIKIGLEYFGPKMKNMIDQVEEFISTRHPEKENQTFDAHYPLSTNDSRLFIYCWRGGMRSAAIAWLLDLYGFKVYTLAGGYKAFRNHVLDTFRLLLPLRILGGYTGSGKTETLKALKLSGKKVIDLEEIAKHKGSAFGNIGMPAQPTQEMFENLLSIELRAMSCGLQATGLLSTKDYRFSTGYIWLEDESQRIGHVNIPNDLWKTMRQSPVYFLDIPFEERLTHLVEEYGDLDQERMIDAIGRIREKLGGLNARTAIQLLLEGNTLESFRILLEYYDKAYLRALHNREGLNSLLHTIESKSITPENANLLIRYSEPEIEKV